jgi:hypothetical protein
VRSVGRASGALAAAILFLVPTARAADEGLHDAASVFFIAKSENRNQVHYGIHLDSNCAPVGERPVFAYWRMLEKGPKATEPLLAREEGAYGLAEQRVLSRDASGGRVRVTLFAMPAHPIVFESRAEAGGCLASANVAVGGARASLSSVFVQLRWPFGVSSLTLLGRALDDGRQVREMLQP